MDHPWRRYFARTFDLFLYQILWAAVMALVFHIPIRNDLGQQVLDTAVGVGIMMAAEPFLLSRLGTTPGKAMWGIRVLAEDGERLSYRAAALRTWGAVRSGLGFQIPVYAWVCCWRSYKRSQHGMMQPWDAGICYTVKDTRWYRAAGFVLANLAGVAALALVVLAGTFPPNRGDLTTAEFVQNYNYLSDFYEMETWKLNPDGSWKERETGDGIAVVGFQDEKLPEFQYQTSDGILTGISFELEETGANGMRDSCEDQLLLAALAFADGTGDIGLFSKERDQLMEWFMNGGQESAAIAYGNSVIEYDRIYEGYEEVFSPYWVPKEDADHYRRYVCFRIRRAGEAGSDS